ncbi:hypothetical protein, partial [Aeropyrum pernix]|uniref:hypothetical protein n=1 Tax=Aeropyrum pernix TaxID=56636 RepID=UPI0010375759
MLSPLFIAAAQGLGDTVFIGLTAVYWLLGAIVYRVSNSIIAAFSTLILPLYLWPKDGEIPLNPSVYAGVSLLAAAAARVLARPGQEGPYADPSIEAVVTAGRLSPAALATALGFATALWLGFHPQQLS